MSPYTRPPMPAYRVAEITARIDYSRLSWRERLLTPPPPGWPGGHLARAIARVRDGRKREESG